MTIFKKWDFWFWFLTLLYLILRIINELALPDQMGLQYLGLIYLLVVTLVGAFFIYGIIKVIVDSIQKIRVQENKTLPIIALVFVLGVAVYVGSMTYRVYFGV